MNSAKLLSLYYSLKPIMPARLLLACRRLAVKRTRRACLETWPILAGSEKKPVIWEGWPDGKTFALILTHDVETLAGVKRCRQLADLEMQMGFRSSFNFCLGDYPIDQTLLDYLNENGFEIGIHGWKHDGNMFESEKRFRETAMAIREHPLRNSTVGFRAPSMYHDFEAIGTLGFEYDLSTFDTDPFEPQPDGVGTIFPFLVESSPTGSSFVELPYTLAQDHMVFIMMQEKTIDLWKTKLDWIVKHGGMALLITHPDYMGFGKKRFEYFEYTPEYYREFLEYVRTKHTNRYWNALPREVAVFVRQRNVMQTTRSEKIIEGSRMEETRPVKSKKKAGTIWIDLDNTPHIPFFQPIINELTTQGREVFVTARDAYQVRELVDKSGLSCRMVGRHYGKNKFLKVAGSLIRATQLIKQLGGVKPVIAVSHGSRPQLIAASLMQIQSMVILDYEYANRLPFLSPNWIVVPEVIPDEVARHGKSQLYKYSGIKEDVYVPFFKPDPIICQDLGLDDNFFIVTIRPPATEAHYFNPQSEQLFESSVKYLLQRGDSQIVMLPRNARQSEELSHLWKQPVLEKKIIIPEGAVNGLNLMWFSDFVISGGGTMNREAAALGVPVYSVFRGQIGAVDRYLSDSGRLVLLKSPDDLNSKIIFTKRYKSLNLSEKPMITFKQIVSKILELSS